MLAGFALAMVLATAEPASFEIEVESNTEVAVYLNGQLLKPGTVYAIKPFYGTRCLTVEVRYVNVDRILTRTFNFEVEAGYHSTWTLKLQANPPKLFST
jgi:hypothetical protein